MTTASSGPLPRFDGYVFDLDGTVYLDDEALPGAVEVIGRLRAEGAHVVFATNKPLEKAADYAAKLTRLGIPAHESDVVTALDSLVLYLADTHSGETLLLVAEPLVGEALTAAGFAITDDPLAADVVVVSFDRTFDYAKLLAAYQAVKAGSVIVATNPDPYCPTADGGLPDCAAMLAAIESCTEARAEAVVGKPSEHMSRALLQRLHVDAAHTAIIGDRLATDVGMGLAAGMTGVLMLTGATIPTDLETSDIQPHYVLTSMHDFFPPSTNEGTPL